MFANVLEFIEIGDMATAVGNNGQGFVLRGDREELDVGKTRTDAVLRRDSIDEHREARGVLRR